MEEKNSNVVEISIIVPVYNAEDRIEKCLISLINQTYNNIEIILINDGSTDNSLNICEQYKIKDNRIRIINKINGGVSSARNRGILESHGKYIVFVDSDDYVDSRMCEKMREAIIKNDSDLVIASYYTIYEDEIMKHECLEKSYGSIEEMKEDFELIYLDCFLNSPWNKLFKKDKIMDFFNEDMHYFEDYYFNLIYIDKIKKIETIKEAFYYYKEDSPSSLTKLYRENIFDVFLIIYEKQLEFCHKYFGDEFDILIKDSLIYGLYNSMQKLVYSNNNKFYKIKVMKEWRNNNTVKLALKDEKLSEYWEKKSLQYRVGFRLIKLSKYNILYYMFSIKKLCVYFIKRIKSVKKRGDRNAYNK